MSAPPMPELQQDEVPSGLAWRFSAEVFEMVHERELTLLLNVTAIDQKTYGLEFRNWRFVSNL